MEQRMQTGRDVVCAAQGGISLRRAEAKHLRAALRQTDLLLATRQIDAGMCHLLELLRHLRALRGGICE